MSVVRLGARRPPFSLDLDPLRSAPLGDNEGDALLRSLGDNEGDAAAMDCSPLLPSALFSLPGTVVVVDVWWRRLKMRVMELWAWHCGLGCKASFITHFQRPPPLARSSSALIQSLDLPVVECYYQRGSHQQMHLPEDEELHNLCCLHYNTYCFTIMTISKEIFAIGVVLGSYLALMTLSYSSGL